MTTQASFLIRTLNLKFKCYVDLTEEENVNDLVKLVLSTIASMDQSHAEPEDFKAYTKLDYARVIMENEKIKSVEITSTINDRSIVLKRD